MSVDLEEIKKALAAATPGPWEQVEPRLVDSMFCGAVQSPDGYGIAGCYQDDADAALIAHAPTWLAELVAEVERLRGEKESAVLAEREACVAICKHLGVETSAEWQAAEIIEAIRARPSPVTGKKPADPGPEWIDARHIRAAVLLERQACLELCERIEHNPCGVGFDSCSEAIRARGEP